MTLSEALARFQEERDSTARYALWTSLFCVLIGLYYKNPLVWIAVAVIWVQDELSIFRKQCIDIMVILATSTEQTV